MPIYIPIAITATGNSTEYPDDERGVSSGAAARYLGITVRHLHRLDSAGQLRPTWRTCGGHRRYLMKALRLYREALESKTNPDANV